MPSFYAKRRVFVLAALVLAGLARPAAAQTYPTQNITFQVAFAAGGIADVVARFVGQKLTERLGQTVVVENRGGAGGNLAAKSVIGAAPDGYTILATTTGLAVNETATKNKGFSVDDLRPVAIVAFSPDVLAIHPSNPAKDLREFIQKARRRASPTAAPALERVRISVRSISSVRSRKCRPCMSRSPAARQP